MARKNRLFAKLANNVDDTGGISLSGLGASATSAIEAAGTAIYDSAGLLPSSGMSAGDQAWSGNRLYISNGTGWYNIALVNANPRFVSITDSDGGTTPFALATDGTTPITITLVGADSDGVDVSYSYTKDSGFDGLATITGSGTEYTVTPLSEDSATATSGTVTFNVSDGISFANSVNTFTLTFAPDWTLTTQTQLITSTDTGFYNASGSIALDAGTLVVGSYGTNSNIGAVYIYTSIGGTWTLQQKITASDAAASDQFGWSVDISGDTIVVGARLEDPSGVNAGGSAYIFTRSGSTWTEQQKIPNPSPTSGDRFGWAVGVHGDTCVITADQDYTGAYAYGRAFVYTRSGSTWTLQQELTPSNQAQYDYFGSSVDIAEDEIVVGSYNSNNYSTSWGGIYYYTRSGSTWTEQAILSGGAASGTYQLGGPDNGAVSISGNTIVGGARAYNGSIGRVHIFTGSGSSWTLQQTLDPDDTVSTNQEFAKYVSLDGDTLAVAAYADDTNLGDQGAVYIFTRSGSTWTKQAKVFAGTPAAYKYLGSSVVLDATDGLVFSGSADGVHVFSAG